MVTPWRPLICLISTIMLLLTNSPGMLEAVLIRVGAPHCHCACYCHAHAGLVADHDCHCHHHEDAAEEFEESDPNDPGGDGRLTTDPSYCPCCPLRPRGGTCGGCTLVLAPGFLMMAQAWLPLLLPLTSLSPEASLLFPFVTPPGLIRPPRA